MSDDEFEKAWKVFCDDHLTGRHVAAVADTLVDIAPKAFRAGWQAAEARLREPQTSETCQAVPPHSKAAIVQTKVYEKWDGIEIPYCAPETISKCLICEAVNYAAEQAHVLQADLEQLKRDKKAARLAFEALAEKHSHLQHELKRQVLEGILGALEPVRNMFPVEIDPEVDKYERELDALKKEKK